MQTVNIHEAKTQLSRLLEAVQRGEEIVIAKAGNPIARLCPIEKRKRVPGLARGVFQYDDSILQPMPDAWIEEMLNGHSRDPLRVRQPTSTYAGKRGNPAQRKGPASTTAQSSKRSKASLKR